ncbi:MAG: fliE [Caulobacteraceae bacterium]|nr:fliE [Caulobacteraceae bacterium]
MAMIDPMSVAKAYASAQESAGGAGGAKFIGSGNDFGDLVKNAISDAVHSSQHAEKQMAAQVQGKAQLVDVATSLASAQSSLETVMAVRDQVISAYQEFMRMTI